MKKLILSLFSLGCINLANAQITITAADMPVSGDTLRSSLVLPTASINLNNTGANMSWDFSAMVPVSQSLDQYKTAVQVNPLYAITISPTAYGYKVADTFSLTGTTLPISITDVYTFFNKKSSPSRFVAEAFAAMLTQPFGATPINYSDEDEWYFFPLQFNDVDSSTFRLSYSLLGLGGFSQNGKRKTTVDGWGTIKTPHFTTAVDCIRLRSELNEVDTVTLASTPTVLPRKTIEYKWLANGEHYPVLWVVTNVIGTTETVSQIRFRDHYRPALGIDDLTPTVQVLNAYPNPAASEATIAIPDSWKSYVVEVFDMKGSLVATQFNNKVVKTSALAKGQYMIRILSGSNTGFVKLMN